MKCIWRREPKGDRHWLIPGCDATQDAEPKLVVKYWNYCPYCGQSLEMSSARTVK